MTKADEGIAPGSRGAVHLGTPASTAVSVGVHELTHSDVRSQSSDYLDDALGEAARHRIEKHLAACPACTSFVDSLRATVRGLAELPSAKAPARVKASIVEQARRIHEASPADA